MGEFRCKWCGCLLRPTESNTNSILELDWVNLDGIYGCDFSEEPAAYPVHELDLSQSVI